MRESIKKILVVKTRWEYYAANAGGILALVLLLSWLTSLLVKNGFELKSFAFWLAIIVILLLLFAIISFFSCMKLVEVTNEGLIVSYTFQQHKNVIRFSEVAEMKSRKIPDAGNIRPRSFRDTFKLVLADGRMFEFERSQFDQYNQLKTICFKKIKI